MIKEDSDSLKCDLAETYRIYDMKAFPLRTIAVFAYGLGKDSRIHMKLSGAECSFSSLLLAQAVDGINLLLWMLGGADNQRPESIVEKMIPSHLQHKGSEDLTVSFDNGEDFEAFRNSLIGGDENG
ncbi:DUF5361 domain-containing protein [Ileibacterium valens]|uniref:Uncharacterized protein n=1 Tax=Ileibacterium valens TaxID=1862668 RepID=A0A1U7NHX7_9FIRM|nr:DUF5361 domain-containing protein [Ileibacterium valens]OLU40465.1 hypothetical protein BO224_05595 [Erysipelotrichaceae bacterium NYU-BL-E8]OLU41685.1 hypothetical protein BO222_02995 [Ileibacterium valens]OLU42889.1 hypothetical protein BM735_01480 [Erysipelotrichaceae bacterium NYU-BL-F16]